MTNADVTTMQQKAAKAAGALYLFIIMGCLLHVPFVLSRLIVKGDAAATAGNIAANELLFRFSTLFEIIMAASVVALAVALYTILKPVSRSLALLALCWRLAEAVLWAMAAIVATMAMQISSGRGLTAFETGQRETLVEVFLGVHAFGLDAVVLFCGLGTIVFSYLLYRAKYIPRLLAIWGLLSYLMCIVTPMVKLLVPEVARLEMIVYSPGALFELAIGAWLLFKGVNVQWSAVGPHAPSPVPSRPD